MLVCKGYRVSFVLVGGRKVSAARSGGMLHDPEGRSWPKCSVLVGPFTRERKIDEALTSSARSYLGRGYQAQRGSVDLPPRALSQWKEIGPVEEIYYVRNGEIFGGQLFRHRFKKAMFSRKMPVLYKLGRFSRLELPSGCVVNQRGFVRP